MPKKRVTHSASYEPPVTPASWGADARMFAQRVKRLFDDLFVRQSKMDNNVKLMPDSIFRAVVDSIYKVGDLFETTVAANDPNKKWTWQKWEQYMPGRVLIGAGVSDYGMTHTAGQIGGEASHTLTGNEMPKHVHGQRAMLVDYTDTGLKQYTFTGGNIVFDWRTAIGSGHSARYYYTPTDESTTIHGTVASMPCDTKYAGGSQSHNNMQPYAVVYRWIRVE